MTYKELSDIIQSLNTRYSNWFRQNNTSLNRELDLFNYGVLAGLKKYNNSDSEVPNNLLIAVKRFEEHLSEKISSIEKYGKNTKYKQIYNIFGESGIKDLAYIMETDDKILIDVLLERYRFLGNTFRIKPKKVWSLYDYIADNFKTEEDDKLIQTKDILDKMPVSNTLLLRYIIGCILNDIFYSLNKFYEKSNARQRVIHEFTGSIDNKHLNELDLHSFKLTNLLYRCNPYKLFYLIAPDYRKVLKDNTYINYWPFSDESILKVLYTKLRFKVLDINKLNKMKLLGKIDNYMGFTLLEALNIRILYESIDYVLHYKS